MQKGRGSCGPRSGGTLALERKLYSHLLNLDFTPGGNGGDHVDREWLDPGEISLKSILGRDLEDGESCLLHIFVGGQAGIRALCVSVTIKTWQRHPGHTPLAWNGAGRPASRASLHLAMQD